jgi:hypothetical protein
MNEALTARIERARYLLTHARNAAMATVNEDGSPHNTPFFFIHNESLDFIYWGSDPSSLHCRNALRTGQIFVVVYESNAGGGLYIKANNAKQLEGTELEAALAVHNALRAKDGKDPIPLSYYSGDSPQAMFSAIPTNFYVNYGERDPNGELIRDVRQEISREELLG